MLIPISILPVICLAGVYPGIGELKITNYTSKEYKAHPQNWAIAQDQKGIMYFGNNQGVLCFDGLNWQLVKTPNESTVRSLDVSPTGKIFVGATGDFGYLNTDELGRWEYVSLRSLYNIPEEDLGDIYDVSAFDNGVYFMSTLKIFFYDGRSLKVFESESAFQSAYKIHDQYIVNQLSTGLCKVILDEFVPLGSVNDFRNMRLYDIIRYNDEDMLVLTEKNGVYNLFKHTAESVHNAEYRTKINTEIQDYNPYNGVFIEEGILSIGTWGYGMLLVDEEGDIVQQVSSESGLIDDVITGQYLDLEGNLWVTTSNGISKISLNENVSFFADGVNIHETVEKIESFNGRIFVGTHTGLYYWVDLNKSGTFRKVPGISSEVWDLLPLGGANPRLLIAGNNAIYQMDKDFNIEKVVSCMPWRFHQLSNDANQIFVGLDDGLMHLRRTGPLWLIQKKIPNIDWSVTSLAENSDGSLWLGSWDNGVAKLDIQNKIPGAFYNYEMLHFMPGDSGLPEGVVEIQQYSNQSLFGTEQGIYVFDESESRFTELEFLNEAMGVENMVIHRMSESKNGQLWVSAYRENDFFNGHFDQEANDYSWHDYVLRPFSSEVVHTIFHADNGETWMGGPNGIMKIDEFKDHTDDTSLYSVQIRKIWINKDSIEFYGNKASSNYQDTNNYQTKTKQYDYAFNSLTFQFVSQYHKYSEQNEYSHMLVGFDKDWSEWSGESKTGYTNLHEGDYEFLVKARNIYGEESSISSYQFKIRAPWFRTWWAYMIYGILAIIVVYVIVIAYTKKLKNIIREKTEEVVQQKEEVESQRHELELKNADITSSINYARRLQKAILPPKEYVTKHLKDSFIVYKPKDIVSGDFYWMEHLNGVPDRDLTLFAAVDCTGHGVPGAFVSVVGNGGLHRAVNEFKLTKPSAILGKLDEIVVETLSKGENDVRDGMDISLCAIDHYRMELQFAGANNSMYFVRKGISKEELNLNGNAKFFGEDMLEVKPNKQPVGYYEFKEEFMNTEIKLKEGDLIYLFSDGFADQFGGEKSKKYSYPRFRSFLLSISEKPMDEQKKLIEREFELWKGKEEQIDDIIVAGIRI